MVERKIIFECQMGSHLYGTNYEGSDLDYFGVFIPSTEDFFGLEEPIKQFYLNKKQSNGSINQAGDVDRKFVSVQEFFRLALLGKSNHW